MGWGGKLMNQSSRNDDSATIAWAAAGWPIGTSAMSGLVGQDFDGEPVGMHGWPEHGDVEAPLEQTVDQRGGVHLVAHVQDDFRCLLVKVAQDSWVKFVARAVGESNDQPARFAAGRLRVASMASSVRVSMTCMRSRKSCPAGVRSTARVVRSNSCTLSSCSSRRICCDSGDCEMFRRAAARVKLRSSATAKKLRI